MACKDDSIKQRVSVPLSGTTAGSPLSFRTKREIAKTILRDPSRSFGMTEIGECGGVAVGLPGRELFLMVCFTRRVIPVACKDDSIKQRVSVPLSGTTAGSPLSFRTKREIAKTILRDPSRSFGMTEIGECGGVAVGLPGRELFLMVCFSQGDLLDHLPCHYGVIQSDVTDLNRLQTARSLTLFGMTEIGEFGGVAEGLPGRELFLMVCITRRKISVACKDDSIKRRVSVPLQAQWPDLPCHFERREKSQGQYSEIPLVRSG